MRLFTTVAALSITTLTAFAAAAQAQDDWRATASAALPESGEIHMQLINNDVEDGFMRLGWVRGEDGVLTVYDRSMLPSAEVFETMSVTMTSADFTPLSAHVRFHQQSAIMSVEADFAGGHARGMRAMDRPLSGRQEAPIDQPLPDGTVLRAATFLLAPYLPLEAGGSLSYDWYAPMAGSVARVTLTAFDGGPVSTPAGDFSETLRIELRGGSPDNDIYVTTGEAPQVVRIDVVGQNMRFERLPEPAAQ